MNDNPTPIGCSAGCGRTTVLVDGKLPPDWDQLQITGRYRCMACSRELTAVNSVPGTPSRDEPDLLPPDSIGSLKPMPHHEPLKERPV